MQRKSEKNISFSINETHKRIKKLIEKENKVLYEYIPTLSSLLYINYEPMSIIRRVRFVLEYLHKTHYRVYYLVVAGEAVGYCVVAPGGRRLKCSTENDIVIGPYYIHPAYRGKGYAKELLRLTLRFCGFDYEYAYDWIAKNNELSIRTTLSCGFEKYMELDITRVMRKLIITNTGEHSVYRVCRNNIFLGEGTKNGLQEN